MGMRATRSDDTILDRVFVPDSHVVRVCPPGMAGADFFVLAIFAWALGGFSNVYYGLAQRMLELATEQVKSQKSLELTRSKAYHPEVQRGVADMVMELEAMGAQIESVTGDWSNGVDHGATWPIKLVAMKYRAVEGAWRSPTRRSKCPAASACSRRARWSACSATRAAAASTRRTRRSRTS